MISVKTTWNALRCRGRGDQKRPYGYQWSLSWNDKNNTQDSRLFFIFVDLKKLETVPDLYIVPARVIKKHFKYGRHKDWNWPRYHPKIKEIERYKNNWNQLK